MKAPEHLRAISMYLAPTRAEVVGLFGLLTGFVVSINIWLCASILVIAGFHYILATLGLRYRKDAQLQRERTIRDELMSSAQLEVFWNSLAKATGLAPPWRISMYELDGEQWKRLTRVSNYPPFRTSGRKKIPIDEGVIAWAARFGGFDELSDLPDPVEDYDAYAQIHSGRRIASRTVARFKMRSRSYACVVTSCTSVTGRSIDVAIMFESETPLGVRAPLIQKHVNASLINLLYRLVSLSQWTEVTHDGLRENAKNRPQVTVES